ncbi:MAG: HAD family hydrolase [Spirochaetales bacterium]|nr:HAD family hydrolase [Spirochaetales bacterium]
MITNIIFDFFGTLVDYSAERNLAVVSTSHDYLRELGFSIDKDRYIEEFDRCFIELEQKAINSKTEFHMEELGKYFFKSCFDYDVAEEQNKKFVEEYIQNWNIQTIFLENIKSFIKACAAKYRLSILSNTHYPPLIHENLKAMKIAQNFFRVYTSVEIGIRKPNREIFLQTLDDLKIKPAQAVFIGDNYHDDYLGALSVELKCFLIDKDKKYNGLVQNRLDHLFDFLTVSL